MTTKPISSTLLPTGRRWRQVRARLREALWVIPTLYVIAATVLAVGLTRLDQQHPLDLGWELSAASASTTLAALGGGMITFTGFVTSVILMIVQFGSSQFSPRFLRWFRSEATLKHALGTFIATFLFALVATAITGRGATDAVPYRALLGALMLTIASIGWFLALISRTSDNLRVARATQRIDAQAREVFDSVYPETHSDVKAAVVVARAVDGIEPVQVLRHRGVGAILVSIDRRALAQLAASHQATIEFVTAVGDHVVTDGPVLRVYGASPISERRLRTGLTFGDERTPEDDPAFTLRLLVDVAIKALSPAVNDPTTAVQSIHRIEDVLRYASAKHLSVGVTTDAAGVPCLIYPTPGWDDLVSLALSEIRLFGAGQYQVARRVRALLEDLIADLPGERRPALEQQLGLLDDAVNAEMAPSQLAPAFVADRQGIGGSGTSSGLPSSSIRTPTEPAP